MIIYLANFLHKLLDTLSNIFRDKPNSNIFLFTFTPPILFLIVLALAFAPMSVDQNREWGFSYPWKIKLGEGNKKKLYYLWKQQQDFSLETMTHKLEKHFSSLYHNIIYILYRALFLVDDESKFAWTETCLVISLMWTKQLFK